MPSKLLSLDDILPDEPLLMMAAGPVPIPAMVAAFAKKYECFVLFDGVCTLSTIPLSMDEWGIDAVITGGQKGLSCIPGVSLIGFSSQAWEYIHARQDQLKHWCLDVVVAFANTEFIGVLSLFRLCLYFEVIKLSLLNISD